MITLKRREVKPKFEVGEASDNAFKVSDKCWEVFKSLEVNNKNSNLLRVLQLECDLFKTKLEVFIENSGELCFSTIDVFLILGILVRDEDNFLDISGLERFGCAEDVFKELDHDSYSSFGVVVDLCVEESNGLKFLSSLCLYLQSFGLDYFNKWYAKHVKNVKLIDSSPFYKMDYTTYLSIIDFKSEEENLCGVVGDLYAIKFSTGVIKVGKSKSGPARIKQHHNEAGRYSVKVVDSYIKYKARLGENALLDFCNKNGKLFYGNEYFKDLDFELVKEFLIVL